ncbi:hypothetical protein KGQ24_02375 [Patescibacteria group bacterium]|nr:hypothetical protein [Patescibacteria group bacterium]
MREDTPKGRLEDEFGNYGFLTPELTQRRNDLRKLFDNVLSNHPDLTLEILNGRHMLGFDILKERPDARNYLLFHDIVGSGNVNDLVTGLDYSDGYIEQKYREYLDKF